MKRKEMKVGYAQEFEKLHKKFFWLGTYILGVGGILCRERPQEAEGFGWVRFVRGN
jgi:hypothetical protein